MNIGTVIVGHELIDMRIGRFCGRSESGFVVDPRVMSDERDRVDGCARPPLAVLLTPTRSLPSSSFSITSSLELLINYKTSVFWSSNHDLPTRYSISSYVPGLPHKRGLITFSSIKYGRNLLLQLRNFLPIRISTQFVTYNDSPDIQTCLLYTSPSPRD